MRGKSSMPQIMAQHPVPINKAASHVLHGYIKEIKGYPTPIPPEGIDCSKWSRSKLMSFFKNRYLDLNSDQLGRMADAAMKDGRIEGGPGGFKEIFKLMSPVTSHSVISKISAIEIGKAKIKYHDQVKISKPKPVVENRPCSDDPTSVAGWNNETEAQVRALVASGASLPNALWRIIPKGFDLNKLRRERRAELNRRKKQ